MTAKKPNSNQPKTAKGAARPQGRGGKFVAHGDSQIRVSTPKK